MSTNKLRFYVTLLDVLGIFNVVITKQLENVIYK